jgi:hypothetical protein
MTAFSSVESATAQVYPSHPITIIVPFAAGGTIDVTARIVGEHMSRTLGRQVVVENIVGAGGTVASTRAMRANPDGYSLVALRLSLLPACPLRDQVCLHPSCSPRQHGPSALSRSHLLGGAPPFKRLSSLYPRGPRSGYVVPYHRHLSGPMRPTRRHIAISPHSGLYAMPSLCGSA